MSAPSIPPPPAQAEPLRIVILEDEDTDFALLEFQLRREGLDFQTRRAVDEAQLTGALEAFHPDLILADFALPQYDGMSALARSRALSPDVPFVLVSGSIGEERVVEALRRGAADCVLKQNLSRLGPVVRRVLQERAEERKRRTAEEGLRRNEGRLRALHDLSQRAATLDEEAIIHTALEEGVSLTDSTMGYLHFVSDDQQTIELKAWSKGVRATCQAGPVSHYPLGEAGVWADCARLRRPVVHNDYRGLPMRHPLPEGHVAILRHLSVPVLEEGRVRMILGVGNKAAAYTETDTHLLQLLANDIWRLIVGRRAVRSLQEREAKLSSIFRAAPTGIGVVTNRVLMEVNERLCEMTGYQAAELIGQSSRILYPTDEDFEWVGREKYRQIREQGTGTVETRWRRKDGSDLHVLLSSSPIDPSDWSAGVTFTATDISARKEAEKAREGLEAQLRHAQKMEAVGQLAGGVAHDFNNLLTVILGNTSLLAGEADLPPGSRELLREVSESAGRAAGLTRQLLTFSRQQVFHFQPVQLPGIIHDIGGMLARLLGETIRLELPPCDPLPFIEADPGMLEQIIVNLAVNARDAMPQGGCLSLRTSLESLDDREALRHPDARAGQFVSLEVSDTGCGMKPEILTRIFDPFFTTKEVGKGTGLGLATVYGIAKQHQGWIEVTSAPGRGSTFRVLFPVTAAPPPKPGDLTPASVVACGEECILVVEDEESVRRLARACLKRCGYQVLEAASGQEALQVWQNCGCRIDLLLTDVVMPEGMDGRALATRLRALQPEIRVLFTSGYSRDLLGEVGADLPMECYLAKPYNLDTLSQAVRRCLEAPTGCPEPAG